MIKVFVCFRKQMDVDSLEKASIDGADVHLDHLNVKQEVPKKRLRLATLSFYGNYLEVDYLGQGTFGKVFSFHGPQGEKYAYKNYNDDVGRTPETSISYTTLREIAILRSISHPNIIGLLDVCLTEFNGHDELNLLMEAGQSTLHSFQIWRKEWPLKLHHVQAWYDTNLSFTRQLIGAVHFLHQHFIWHRDLKPANILLFNNKILRICDFGSAKTNAIPGGQPTPNMQTVCWRAPEIILMGEIYDNKIDVFALGVIIAELYINSTVFNVREEKDLLLRQLTILGGIDSQNWPSIKEIIKQRVGFDPQSVTDDWNRVFHGPNVPTPVPDDIKDLVRRMTIANPQKRASIEEAAQMPAVQLSAADLAAGSFDPGWSTTQIKKTIQSPKITRLRAPGLYLYLLEMSANLTRVVNYSVCKDLLDRYFTYCELLLDEDGTTSPKKRHTCSLSPSATETAEQGILLGAIICIASKLLDRVLVKIDSVVRALFALGLAGITASGQLLTLKDVEAQILEMEFAVLKIIEFDILPSCTTRELYKKIIPTVAFFGQLVKDIPENVDTVTTKADNTIGVDDAKLVVDPNRVWMRDSKNFSIYCSVACGILEAFLGNEMSTESIMNTVMYAGLSFAKIDAQSVFTDEQIEDAHSLLPKFKILLHSNLCFIGTEVNLLLAKVPVLAVFSEV